MENKPVLIIMAAGMGSRYGGLKQLDRVGSGGEMIMDFSIYDAMLAGFDEVIFIIKKDMEEEFKKIIEAGAGRFIKTSYAFQELKRVPEGISVPETRVKPWGTGQAVLAAEGIVKGPFAVINADDYYGADAFIKMYEFLSSDRCKEEEPYGFAMIGYKVENTLTENGHVSRGICEVDEKSNLKSVTERTKIFSRDDRIFYEEDGIENEIPEGTYVSMNFWGFSSTMMEELKRGFEEEIIKIIEENPAKGEYYLPKRADQLVAEKKATVKVLESTDRWYGVTYKEDREMVVNALQAMKDKGLYPEKLWK